LSKVKGEQSTDPILFFSEFSLRLIVLQPHFLASLACMGPSQVFVVGSWELNSRFELGNALVY
jgi:hypothetical protein